MTRDPGQTRGPPKPTKKASIEAQEVGSVTNALTAHDRERAGLYKLSAAELSNLNEVLLKLLQKVVAEASKDNPKP